MSFVNDPWDKAIPPKGVSTIEEVATRDYHEFFWDEAVQRSLSVGKPQRAYTQVCRFNEAGEHISFARDCPHFNQEDEMGRPVRKGWSVQGG